jgi:hypothetical protein
VEYVSGFMLTAFKQPGAAVLWGLQLQEQMLAHPWWGGWRGVRLRLCCKVVSLHPKKLQMTHPMSLVNQLK